MSVYCRQSVNGESQPVLVIEPHSDTQTDSELLAVKARGAEDKGWSVEWTAHDRFTARKVRWQAQDDVTREFWAD